MSEEQELIAVAGYVASDVASKVKDLTDAQVLQQQPAESRWQYILARAFLRVNGQRSRLGELEARIQGLKANNTDLTRQANELDAELRDAQEAKVKAYAKVAKLEKECARLKADIAALDCTNTTLRTGSDMLRKDKAVLNANLHSVTIDFKESEAECERLRADRTALRDTITEQLNEIQKLKAELNDSAEVRKLEAEIRGDASPGTFNPDLSAEDIHRIEHAILHWEEDGTDCDDVRSLVRGTLPAGYGESVGYAIGRLQDQRICWGRTVELLQKVVRMYNVWNGDER